MHENGETHRGETEMTNLQVYADNLISLDGRYVGRIDRDSFAMPSGQRGKTSVRLFDTGQNVAISAPLYVPTRPGSVSDWTLNPEFAEELEAASER
jgi:hypothetical protein